MKKKETVNIRLIDSKPPEGRMVFYQSSHGAPIHRGEVVYCEKCQKACVANSVGVLSFNSPTNDIQVHSQLFDGPELGHCDALEMAVCDTCYLPSEEE